VIVREYEQSPHDEDEQSGKAPLACEKNKGNKNKILMLTQIIQPALQGR